LLLWLACMPPRPVGPERKHQQQRLSLLCPFLPLLLARVCQCWGSCLAVVASMHAPSSPVGPERKHQQQRHTLSAVPFLPLLPARVCQCWGSCLAVVGSPPPQRQGAMPCLGWLRLQGLTKGGGMGSHHAWLHGSSSARVGQCWGSCIAVVAGMPPAAPWVLKGNTSSKGSLCCAPASPY